MPIELDTDPAVPFEEAPDAAQKRIANQKLAFLAHFAATLGNISVTCSLVGVTRQTYYNWIKADPQFAIDCNNVVDTCCDNVETALYSNCLGGSVPAQIFYLKNRRPDRWKNETDVNMRGPVFIKVTRRAPPQLPAQTKPVEP